LDPYTIMIVLHLGLCSSQPDSRQDPPLRGPELKIAAPQKQLLCRTTKTPEVSGACSAAGEVGGTVTLYLLCMEYACRQGLYPGHHRLHCLSTLSGAFWL